MAPLRHGLPDEIIIWEILVRLPPKALLRCRIICRAWRRDVSTCEFLNAHHHQQPSLPLLRLSIYENNVGISLNIVPFEQQSGVAGADQLRSAARFGTMAGLMLKASCDGLVVIRTCKIQYFICNPATRQCARLPVLSHKALLGMYQHHPTGEYRILFYSGNHDCYVFTLGSGQPPRQVVYPPPLERDLVPFYGEALLFRGSLHWHPLMCRSGKMIVAFDTVGETFRLMHAPHVPGHTQLFEMDGMLIMSTFINATSTIDIWMMEDYKSEVWTFKQRVELPIAEIKAQCGNIEDWNVIIVPRDGKLPMLVQFDKWVLQVDLDGKLVASFPRGRLVLTQHRLKQTLVSHSFFPKLDGYAVNGTPLITPDNYVVNTS